MTTIVLRPQTCALSKADIVVGQRTRKTVGDLGELRASIEAIGLLHPIVVDDDKRLIAGQRRLEACKLLGWNTVAVHVVRLQNILRGECDENVVRADFTPSEQNSIAQALEERERLAAKERQSEAGKQFGRGIASAKFAQATEKGKSRANPSAQVCALVA